MLGMLVLALAGCVMTVDQSGDPTFVEMAGEVSFEIGVTKIAQVTEALGPPDAIERREDELWFFYTYSDLRSSKLVLNYYVNLFTFQHGNRIDTTLAIAFDELDQLLYMGSNRLPTADMTRFVR